MEKKSLENKSKATQWRTVSYSHNGETDQVEVETPSNVDAKPDEEVTHFVQTLEDNQQIAHGSEPLTTGKTHQIETDEDGKKRLVRKRYSAI
jgi:hypothetical protein